MMSATKITKAQFYALGAFSNPRLIRVTRGRSWAYFMKA